MKRAKITGERTIEVLDVPEPEPGPGQVKIRIECSGVCGSDLLEWQYPNEFSHCLGHEFSGTVTDIGEAVPQPRPGDRVAAHAYGAEGFSEYAVIKAENAYVLPDGLSMEEGALLEPVVVVLGGLRYCGFRVGDTCFIAGCGTLGLLAIELMRSFGARRIVASEPNEARRSRALGFGADRVIDPVSGSIEETVLEAVGSKVDFALDCAGSGESLLVCGRVTRHNHSVCVLGLTPRALDVSTFDLFTGMVKYHGSTPADFRLFEVAARMILDRKIAPRGLVTHHFPLEDIADAFELASGPRTSAIKIMIHPER